MSDSPLSDPPLDAKDGVSTPATSLTALSGGGKKRSAPQPDTPNKRTKRGRTAQAPAYKEEDDSEADISKATPKKSSTPKKKGKVTAAVKVEEEVDIELSEDGSPKKVGKKTTVKKKVKAEESDEGGAKKKAVRKPRKTKEEKEAEAMPLAARTVGSKLVVGAHISAAGGVQNAVTASVHIGGNAFALFLKSQRKWVNPALSNEHCTQFLSNCKEHKYDSHTHKTPPIVPHGSYLVNLAHPDPDRTKQAYDTFLDDLDRCRKLGIQLYNFHPGNSAANESRAEAIKHLAGQLNKAHKDPSSGTVITLLETMAAGGNVLGSTFEDLASTIDLIEQKDRVGVCLDTCHVFAAGYDLRTPSALAETITKFDEIIGLKYLKAFHMNDSKAPLASERDLHANIGTGFLGLRSFHNIVNEPRLWGLPMILETPIDVKDKDTGKEVQDKSIWAGEVKLLESLVGMDVESEEFLKLEKELQAKGSAERDRVQDQVDRRKDKKKNVKGKGGKKKGKKGESSDGEESGSE